MGLTWSLAKGPAMDLCFNSRERIGVTAPQTAAVEKYYSGLVQLFNTQKLNAFFARVNKSNSAFAQKQKTVYIFINLSSGAPKG